MTTDTEYEDEVAVGCECEIDWNCGCGRNGSLTHIEVHYQGLDVEEAIANGDWF